MNIQHTHLHPTIPTPPTHPPHQYSFCCSIFCQQIFPHIFILCPEMLPLNFNKLTACLDQEMACFLSIQVSRAGTNQDVKEFVALIDICGELLRQKFEEKKPDQLSNSQLTSSYEISKRKGRRTTPNFPSSKAYSRRGRQNFPVMSSTRDERRRAQPVVYMFFFNSHFVAACLRESNSFFREVADILFVSYQIITNFQLLITCTSPSLIA